MSDQTPREEASQRWKAILLQMAKDHPSLFQPRPFPESFLASPVEDRTMHSLGETQIEARAIGGQIFVKVETTYQGAPFGFSLVFSPEIADAIGAVLQAAVRAAREGA